MKFHKGVFLLQNFSLGFETLSAEMLLTVFWLPSKILEM